MNGKIGNAWNYVRVFIFLLEWGHVYDSLSSSSLIVDNTSCGGLFDCVLFLSRRVCMRRIPYSTSRGQLNFKRARNELNTTKETVHMCKIEIRISLPVQGRKVEIQLDCRMVYHRRMQTILLSRRLRSQNVCAA